MRWSRARHGRSNAVQEEQGRLPAPQPWPSPKLRELWVPCLIENYGTSCEHLHLQGLLFSFRVFFFLRKGKRGGTRMKGLAQRRARKATSEPCSQRNTSAVGFLHGGCPGKQLLPSVHGLGCPRRPPHLLETQGLQPGLCSSQRLTVT